MFVETIKLLTIASTAMGITYILCHTVIVICTAYNMYSESKNIQQKHT